VPQSSVSMAGQSNSAAPSCDCVAHVYGNAADRPGRQRRYPSEMTDGEWAVVRPLLPVPGWMRGRGGRPGAYGRRAMLDAIRYLVRRRGQRGLIDSQSVKADAVVGTDSRGFDGGNLINGRKRHVVVDTLGLLLGVIVTAADTGDRTAAQELLGQVADVRDRPLLPFLLGRGQFGLDAIGFLTQPVDSTRAASSCCSSSPTTDGIRNLPGSDDTTRHHSRRITVLMPDQRKRHPQIRNNNSHQAAAARAVRGGHDRPGPDGGAASAAQRAAAAGHVGENVHRR
jgi:transposase